MPPELREALEDAIKQSEAAAPEASAPEAEAAPDTDIAAASAVESEPAADAAPPEGESPAPVEDGGDAEQGAKAEKAAAPVAEEKPAQQSMEDRIAHRVDRAPTSWKKDVKATWAELPLSVRQEIHRREQHINTAMLENSKNREVVEQFNRVTTPYMARLQGMGGALPAVERLLQTEYQLATGNKRDVASMMAKLIQDYEVDIGELDNILSGQAPSPQQAQQPDISSIVQQQLQQALAPLYQQQQQKQQQIQQEAVTTVEQMSLDPNFPHFEEVREDMADIIDLKAKKGVAIGLQEAYNIAIQMNPETRGQMQRQASVQTATQHHQQAQRAKAAASSVTGAPAAGGAMTAQGDGSLRGAIEAAFGGQRL